MIDGVWPAWNGTRLICGGCGRSAPPLDRATAVAVIEDLTGRLWRLATDPRVTPGSAGAALFSRATAQVGRTLAGLNAHLGGLSPLDGPTGGAIPPGTGPPGGDAGRADWFEVLDAAARLTWTISTLSDPIWGDRSPGTVVAPAAELVWTALHHARHAVEDVELCVRPARAAPTPRPTAPAPGMVPAVA